jgi:hypothetical protein
VTGQLSLRIDPREEEPATNSVEPAEWAEPNVAHTNGWSPPLWGAQTERSLVDLPTGARFGVLSDEAEANVNKSAGCFARTEVL